MSTPPVAPTASLSRPPLPWLLLPFALGYGASYFFRNVNAVAGPLLAQEFGLGAGGLGFLTSSYFLAFSLAQIPLGIALDRFGPARVNAVMLTTAAAGATVFGCAESTAALAAGRALIGAGAGAALMSSMSAVHLWAGRERAATCIGWMMTLGGAGAMLAGSPTQWLIDAIGWRAVFFILATACALCAVWTLAISRHGRPPASGQSLRQLLGGLGRVYATPWFWRICLSLMLTLGTMLAFQSLWTATWMRDVAGMNDKLAIGNVLVAFNVGMTIAFVSAGWFADRLKARGITHLSTLKGYFLLALAAQAWLMAAPTLLPHLAWGLFGFAANALVLAYAMLATRFPPELTGRVNTSMNLMSFSCAFFLQWGIGLVVNLWPATATGYAPEGYFAAWGALFALQVFALGWLVSAGPMDDARAPGVLRV